LGQSRAEYERLVRQGQYLEPMTRRVFAEAGIQPGMRVLDLGSGAGDVCLLLAELVGPQGSVTGLEMDAGAIAFAQERIAARGLDNITLVETDIRSYVPEQPFDAIVSRMVLLYLPDPGAVLTALTPHLRPGGVVALMEPWFTPPVNSQQPAQRLAFLIMETMRRSGAHLDLGPRLHKVFAAAGLDVPQMRFETVLDASENSPLFQMTADSIANLLPKAIEYGIATPGEIDIAAVPALLRGMLNAAGYPAMMLPTVSAWGRKPAA
jgi:ubiquinone/menaquinone biosynthesis C-methylase UbiE